jgi:carboxyl-terminal processing protease
LRLTTASYWRPSGKNIDRTVLTPPQPGQYGVSPDPGFDVPLDEDLQIRIRRLRNQRDVQFMSGQSAKLPPGPDDWFEADKQLQRASEYLLELVNNKVAA